MGVVIPATDYLLENEPCYRLTEIDRMSPMGQMRRYRTFTVIRGDKLAAFFEDMGLSKKQKYDQLWIPAGGRDEQTGRLWIEHTVAELRGIAQDIKRYKRDKLALARVNRIKNP